jgi:hypothetical protein
MFSVIFSGQIGKISYFWKKRLSSQKVTFSPFSLVFLTPREKKHNNVFNKKQNQARIYISTRYANKLTASKTKIVSQPKK